MITVVNLKKITKLLKSQLESKDSSIYLLKKENKSLKEVKESKSTHEEKMKKDLEEQNENYKFIISMLQC